MVREIAINASLIFLSSNIFTGLITGTFYVWLRSQKFDGNMEVNWEGLVRIEAIILMISTLGGISSIFPSLVQQIIFSVMIIVIIVYQNVTDS